VPKDPADTRLLLLEAAERLMAEHGADGVSLREISAGAGQANNNAAAYHFGSREGIIEAVLDLRMGPIDARRAEMIAALRPTSALRDLVSAVVVPLAEASRRHEHYIGFFAQLRVSRRYSHLVAHASPRTASFLAVRDQIDARLADLPPAERSRRRWLCGSLIVHAIAEFVAAPAEQPYATWDELIEGIVTACVHVLGGGTAVPGGRARATTTSSGRNAGGRTSRRTRSP
jgi:AcrR family transcriptional regulator